MEPRPQNPGKSKKVLPSSAGFLGVISCLLAIAVVAGGVLLADHQGSVLGSEHRRVAEERDLLIGELERARLTGPRLRLEELATLPLIAEFVDLAVHQPGSADARELRDYLQTVLEATSLETGLEGISILDTEGSELLGTGDLFSNEVVVERHELSAVVHAFDDPLKAAGKLTGYVPKTGVIALLPSDATSPATTAGIPSPAPIDANDQPLLDVPRTTRMLALVAGIAIAVSGLTGAFLLRRQANRST